MSTVTNYKVNGTDLGSIFQIANTTTVINNSTMNSIFSNSSGTILIAIYNGTLYKSINGGTSWTAGTAFPYTQNGSNIVCDSTGQIILTSATTGTEIYFLISKNQGVSYTFYWPGLLGYGGICHAISKNGQYMFIGATSNFLWVSSNTGTSFSTKSLTTVQTPTSITCSDSGQYMYMTTSTGIKISTTYGSSIQNGNISTILTTSYFTNVCCNGDGSIILLTQYNDGTYISFDYGANWTKTTLPSSIAGYFTISGTVKTTNGYVCSCCDSTGQYWAISFYVSGNTSGQLYISNNFGNTWIPISIIGSSKITSLTCDNTRSTLFYTTQNLYTYSLQVSKLTTNYLLSNGTDISQLFQPYTSGVYGPQTNYLTSTGVDLNTLFTVNTTFYNSYPTYTITGTGTTQTLNGYTIVTFTVGTGSITFNKPVTNFGCICVGGGGGGGVGQSRAGGNGSGDGGGGGGAYLYTTNPNITTTSLTYNVSVGSGGSGGNSSIVGTNGGSSSVSINSNIIINCTGGKVNAGGGGIVDVPGGVTYNGGNGGNNANGTSSTSYTTHFAIPSAITSVVKTSYGGGGGGSGANKTGGAAGLNGLGGTQSGNTVYTGQTATSYGSGGGGGGNTGQLPTGSSTIYYNGGNGAPGVVIFYFQ